MPLCVTTKDENEVCRMIFIGLQGAEIGVYLVL